MSTQPEEIQADLLWRYVEHLREAQREGRLDAVRLSRRELEELRELLELAGRLPEASPATDGSSRQQRVRELLDAALMECAPAPVSAPPRPPRVRFRPRFRLQHVALGLCVLLGAALLTVDRWHHPHFQTGPNSPHPLSTPPGVHLLTDAQAQELVHRRQNASLAPEEEESLRWHLLHCPKCLDEYAHTQHMAVAVEETLCPWCEDIALALAEGTEVSSAPRHDSSYN